MSTSIVDGGNGLVFLLPGGIPDLELDIFVVYYFGFGYECSAEGWLAELVELVIGVTVKDAALTYAGIANHNAFYQFWSLHQNYYVIFYRNGCNGRLFINRDITIEHNVLKFPQNITRPPNPSHPDTPPPSQQTSSNIP